MKARKVIKPGSSGRVQGKLRLIFGEKSMRLIASLAIAAIAVSFSTTASAGLFKKSAVCDAASSTLLRTSSSSCVAKLQLHPADVKLTHVCKPARKQLLKGLIAKLHARKAACCEPAPTCCEPAPAPAPCCEPAPAPAPSCGCEVAAPSCGCEVDPCAKPARKHVLKNLFGKLHARKAACCEPAPSCGCEVLSQPAVATN